MLVADGVAGAELPRLLRLVHRAPREPLDLLETAMPVKKMWWLPRMPPLLNSRLGARAIKTGVA
jgi:hypothetical protein